jgi:hypothetical protein
VLPSINVVVPVGLVETAPLTTAVRETELPGRTEAVGPVRVVEVWSFATMMLTTVEVD